MLNELTTILKDKRQALINKAVTHGLDNTVTLEDTKIKWIGKIPEKWDYKRLKFVSKTEMSSVDRHVLPDEKEVLVCHYPDVYKNEFITSELNLNKGTCSINEFEKSRLKKDDVLITKDSETPDDIGVPTYVPETLVNTVCGYHIAQITTRKNILLGSFLFRFLQSDLTSGYFEAHSNGVTRYGLGKEPIENLWIPLPPVEEQQEIVNYLNEQTSLIDSIIESKEE